MSVNLNNYNNIMPQNTNTPKKQQGVVLKAATTIATAGIILGASRTNAAQKAIKSVDTVIKEAMPELKSKAKSLWGKITGSTKREEARKAAEEENLRIIREQAHKERLELEARYKEEKQAIENRKKSYAEAAKQKQTQQEKTETKPIKTQKETEAISKEKEIQKLAEIAKVDGQNSITGLLGLRITEKEFTHLNDETKRKILSFCNPDGTINFNKIANNIKDDSSAYFLTDIIEKLVTRLSENSLSKEMIEKVKTMENAGLSFEQIKEVFQNIKKISDSELETLKNVFHLKNRQTLNLECRIKANNEKLDYINSQLASKTPQNGESATEFITNILNQYKAEKLAKQEQHLRNVHSKIKYTDTPCVEYFANNPNYQGPLKGSARQYTSFEGQNWDNDKYNEIFRTFPRYKDEHGNAAIRQEYSGVHPLVRWISTPWYEINPHTGHLIGLDKPAQFKTSKEFVERFQVGETYVLPSRQSCSKYFEHAYGDNNYGDLASDKDIKFIFIPKSKNGSRAVDLLDCGYKGSSSEALYLPGEKFIVLDKRVEEVERQNGSFYRWIIEMQEA